MIFQTFSVMYQNIQYDLPQELVHEVNGASDGTFSTRVFERGRADFRGNTQSGVVRCKHYLMRLSLAQVRSFDSRRYVATSVTSGRSA